LVLKKKDTERKGEGAVCVVKCCYYGLHGQLKRNPANSVSRLCLGGECKAQSFRYYSNSMSKSVQVHRKTSRRERGAFNPADSPREHFYLGSNPTDTLPAGDTT